MALNLFSGFYPSFKVEASDFGFAINDRKFSDCVLRLEITADVQNGQDRICLIDSVRGGKRKREEDTGTVNDLATAILHEDHNIHSPKRNRNSVFSIDDEDAPPVREMNLHASIVASNLKDSAVLQVKQIHISSIILAAKSTYFCELFSNVKMGSEDRYVTIRIQASEEDALMELLGFMYCNTLSTRSKSGLLDVLMAADKYGASSCVDYCSKLLQTLPLTCVYALIYLDLPSMVDMVNAVQPLAESAKEYLAKRYKKFTKYQKDLLKLPLAVIEVVLSSDELQVDSEDDIYDFAVSWVNLHFTNPDKRREALTNELAPLIRFHLMSTQKLNQVLSCIDLDPNVSSKLVLDALFLKVEPSYRLRAITESSDIPNERDYNYIPIKVIEFESPKQQYIVYFNIKWEKCARLYPNNRIESEPFDIAGQSFFFSTYWTNDDFENRVRYFGLFLEMRDKKPSSENANISIDYQFFAMSKISEEFVRRDVGSYNFSNGRSVGCMNMFDMAWSPVIVEDGNFFVNHVLHLRADIVVKAR